MVKITVFREDNQPVLHLQRRQSTSASYFGKTIVLVLKKTILLEKTILPFPTKTSDFFCKQLYFSKQILKRAKITILVSMKNSKNNNTILVFSISPIQLIQQ